jgi:hypothetical protein
VYLLISAAVVNGLIFGATVLYLAYLKRHRMPDETVRMVYTNWRGETQVRTIIPRELRYGTTRWHKQPTYLLRAFDVDRREEREFDLKQCAFLSLDP